MAKKETVKVRVKGTQPIVEDSTLRQPRRQEPDGKGGLKWIEADVFEVEPERAAALGDAVEIIPAAAKG